MKPTIIKPASRDEWLKAREDGIGASEVAAVVGLSPWETPFSLWLRKTGQVPPIEENEAMHLGHLLEGIVAQLWEEKTGFRAVKASAKDIIYQDAEHPWRKVTPDRIAYEVDENGKKKKVLLEIKTSRMEFDPDDLPVHYLCQVQYQMHVTGVHVCYLCWLASGLTYGHARIDYDADFASWLVENVDAFYLDCVKGVKEPEAISVSDFAIKGSTPGTSVEADKDTLSKIMALRQLNIEHAKSEGDIETYKDSLKMLMGEKESIIYEGQVLATWKSGAKSRTFRLKDKAVDELINKGEEETC